MKIIDTFEGIERCYKNGKFQKSEWDKYMNEYLPFAKERIENVAEKYNYQKDVLPVLNNLIENRDKLVIAHNSFCELVDGIDERLRSTLDTELDVTVVFYLGLCCGAGWAVENLKGKRYILLGVEKIVELNWQEKNLMAGLIYHELGHLWHFSKRDKLMRKFKSEYLWQLYTEGMAMYAQELLVNDGKQYHQYSNEWLVWCNENEEDLYKEYLRRIDSEESCQDFFGDWCGYLGHSDIGYYLGCELIRNLAQNHSPKDLVNLKESDVYDTLKNV